MRLTLRYVSKQFGTPLFEVELGESLHLIVGVLRLAAPKFESLKRNEETY